MATRKTRVSVSKARSEEVGGRRWEVGALCLCPNLSNDTLTTDGLGVSTARRRHCRHRLINARARSERAPPACRLHAACMLPAVGGLDTSLQRPGLV